jgi:predicted nucleic acid-binding protein
VVRVLNLPAYSQRGPLGLGRVRDRLAQACAQLDHEFWPDDLSVRDPSRLNFDRIHGHNQLTDAYLLALAVHRRGCLVTFDRAIALDAVHGATARHLTVLA